MKNIKKIIELFFETCLDLLLLCTVLCFLYTLFLCYKENSDGELRFFMGYKPMVVSSASMEDEIKKGDIILVSQNYGSVDIGDIVLFKRGSSYVVHRFVAIDERAKETGSAFMITKGDNNEIEDPSRIYPEDVIGKVVRVFDL